MRINAVVYDVEIRRCILDRDERPDPTLKYCGGWKDYKGMGIACVVVNDLLEGRYRVFCEDNLDDLQALMREREHIAGFNIRGFDEHVLRAHGVEAPSTYDLLEEVRLASGQRPPRWRKGYDLDAVAGANSLGRKTANGKMAPIWWQQGFPGKVIDYCTMDVALETRLFSLSQSDHVADPTTGAPLIMRRL